MAKFHFRFLAESDPQNWDLTGTVVAGCDPFTVYMFREGERTYCCSLTPDAWCEFVENQFSNPDGTFPELSDEDAESMFDLQRESGDEHGCYFQFHYVAGRDKRFVSKRLTIEVDVRTHHTAGVSWDDAWKAAAEAAWEEAREYVRCNSRESIPVIDDPAVWRAVKAEHAARAATASLFAEGSSL